MTSQIRLLKFDSKISFHCQIHWLFGMCLFLGKPVYRTLSFRTLDTFQCNWISLIQI